MKLREKLKYRFNRLRVKQKQKARSKIELEESQEMALAIIKDSVKDPNSEILYSPSTGTYYVDWPAQEVTLSARSHKIEIANGVYHYDIPIYEKIFKEVQAILDLRLKKKCNKLALKLDKTKKKNLDNIINSNSNKK